MKLKRAFLLAGTIACVILAVPHAASGDGPGLARQEVLIGNIFVPQVGYEDKNDIEITLDGYLPNSCYQIADTQVAKGLDPFALSIHQFAERRTDGVCSEASALPPEFQDIVPYTLNFSLGHLQAGDYKLLFDLGSSPARASIFNVAHAQNMAVDDYPYASVSAVEIPDVVNGTHPVKATLEGRLITTCQFIKQVKVLPEPEAYTFVVLPILGFRVGVMCAQIVTPFEYPIHLGSLGEGRYLIHVRTQNGRASTRVFSVVKPDPSLSQEVSTPAVREAGRTF